MEVSSEEKLLVLVLLKNIEYHLSYNLGCNSVLSQDRYHLLFLQVYFIFTNNQTGPFFSIPSPLSASHH